MTRPYTLKVNWVTAALSFAISYLADNEMPTDQYADFRSIYANVVKMLNRALDAFARLDVENALRVFADDEEIDRGYNTRSEPA